MDVLYFQPNDAPAGALKLSGAHARARELSINLHRVRSSNNDSRIRQLLKFWKPDGCIFECGDTAIYPANAVFGHTPVVFIDRDPRSLPRNSLSINLDSRQVGEIGARELLRLGFDDYAFIPAAKAVAWCQERGNAFMKAIRLNNATVHLCPRHSSSPTDVAQISRFLSSLPRPCGIFAADDVTGALVLSIIGKLKLKVPNDFAVIAVDDDPEICENTYPTLSSITPDFHTAGRMAIDLLLVKHPAHQHFGILGMTRRTSSFLASTSNQGIAAALDLIRTQACSGLHATAVIATMGVSRRLAERRFLAATGMTILNAIRQQRLQEVFRLLTATDTALSAIPAITGWKSETAFRTYFRNTTGMSMREYRQTKAKTLSLPR